MRKSFAFEFWRSAHAAVHVTHRALAPAIHSELWLIRELTFLLSSALIAIGCVCFHRCTRAHYRQMGIAQ